MAREWEDYSEHVLRSLARIEKKLEEQGETFSSHVDRVDKRVTKVENDVKWHTRIGSTAGMIALTLFAWLFRHDL